MDGGMGLKTEKKPQEHPFGFGLAVRRAEWSFSLKKRHTRAY